MSHHTIEDMIPTQYDEQPDYKGGSPVRTKSGQLLAVKPEGITEVPTEPALKETPELAGRALDPSVAATIARMQEEISRLTRDVQKQSKRMTEQDEAELSEGGFPWQYYKRPERGPEAGWVVTAPGGEARPGRLDASARAIYMTKGFKVLTDYGVAPIPSDASSGRQYITMLENGGAREFPASQVLAFKWHLTPPLPGTVFPQYEARKADVLAFVCDECDCELFFLPEDMDTPRSAFNHLRQGHQYNRQEAMLALEAQGIKNVAPYAIKAASNTPTVAPAPATVAANSEQVNAEGTSELYQGLQSPE